MKTDKEKLKAQLKSQVEIMYAVEMLEYHDKNYLSGDNMTRCEQRQKSLQYCLEILAEI